MHEFLRYYSESRGMIHGGGTGFVSRALSLEPGIPDAYYWISIAAEATGNSMMKDRYEQMAREELPEEEYQKVQHLLEIRTHTTE